MLERSFPGSAEVEVWELVPMGFTDEVRGLSVDGFGWRRVDWDGGWFVARDQLDGAHQ